MNSIEELEKIAYQITAEAPNDVTMNPQPDVPSQEEVDALQAENQMLEEAIAKEKAQKQSAPEEVEEQILSEGQPTEQELLDAALAQADEQALVEALTTKTASELINLGTIAKLVECAYGDCGEELQKEASSLIKEMTESEEAFEPTLQKVANSLFAKQQNLDELFSVAGVSMVFEQLARFENDDFEKVADEDGGFLNSLRSIAGNAIDQTKQKVSEAIDSVVNFNQINSEFKAATKEIETLDTVLRNGIHSGDALDQKQHYDELIARQGELGAKQRLAKGILGGAGALALGGAALGGYKLNQHLNQQQEQLAGEIYSFLGREKTAQVLPQQVVNGTLETEIAKNDGGIGKMSQQRLVKDFLKLAGAAGLVGIIENENLDMGIRKEASETLDRIAMLGRSQMDEELVKIAQTIYPENELHEIVSNQHTPQLVEKVAYFLNANETSIDELEKTANAGGVAAVKNLGAGLADSVSNIEATIDTEKAKTEGAGREYIGDAQNGGGKAGGAITGDLAGYNVVNNPAKYDVEQTASALEEAFLAKQAAAETYQKADAFIQSVLASRK